MHSHRNWCNDEFCHAHGLAVEDGWASRISVAGTVAFHVGQAGNAAGEHEDGVDAAVLKQGAERVPLQIARRGTFGSQMISARQLEDEQTWLIF